MVPERRFREPRDRRNANLFRPLFGYRNIYVCINRLPVSLNHARASSDNVAYVSRIPCHRIPIEKKKKRKKKRKEKKKKRKSRRNHPYHYRKLQLVQFRSSIVTLENSLSFPFAARAKSDRPWRKEILCYRLECPILRF